MRSRKNIYTKNESGSFEYAGKTMYQYLGSQLAYQCTYNAAGEVDTEFYFFYDSYDKLAAIRYIKGSTDHYYYATTNLQGDVLGIYSASGVLLASYEYDAWGNCSVTSHNENYTIGYDNPIRYRGYYYDTETGLYYLQSRYYNPQIGRFLNADSEISRVGGEPLGNNLFAYCQNNPVNMSDPTGHWPDLWKFVGGASLAFSGMSAITAVTVGALACLNPIALGAIVVAGVAAIAIGASEMVESFNGYNMVRDDVLQGNEAAYNVVRTVSSTVSSTATLLSSVTSVCFVAGTYVLSQLGLIEIESIEVGDKVWSENPETGQKELKTVVNTFINETSELVHVFVNGEEIVTTPEHPFYVPKKGWVGSISLRAGDILVLQNGEYVTVEKIQHEILEQPVTVYNFEVEDFHTYYVGNSSVLVHNKCVVKQNGVKIEVRTSNEHGLPHGHVSGNGPNTTIGLNQKPMKNHPNFSKKQMKVIEDNWEVIKNGIIELFPKK